MSIKQYATKTAGTLWRLDIKIGGKTITRRGFKTQLEAKKEERRLRNEADFGVNLTGPKMKLSDYLDFWMGIGNSRDWSENQASRVSQLMTPIRDNIGHIKLENIRHSDIVKLRSILREKWADRTVKHAEVQLKAALEDAVKNKLIATSPLAGFETVSMRNAELKEIEIFEPSEQIKLIEGARDYSAKTDVRWFAIIFLALNSGLRKGELFALQWKHLNLKDELLHVRQSLEFPPGKTCGVLKRPKTKAGLRTVELSSNTCAEMALYKLATQELFLKFRKKLSPDDFVFFSDEFRPLPKDALRSRWETIQKTNMLPMRTFHTLRHTHASAMIAMGMDIKNLQERLGHTSPTVTLNTYGHLYKEQKRDVNKRALNAWEASLRDVRDTSHDNLLKIVDGSAKR